MIAGAGLGDWKAQGTRLRPGLFCTPSMPLTRIDGMAFNGISMPRVE